MYWDCLKRFFKYFVDDKKTFAKYFALSFVVGVLELFGVALTYPFINRIMTVGGDTSFDKVSVCFGIFIILAFLAKNLFMVFYTSLQADFTKNCEANINKKFMHYFLFGDYTTVSRVSFAQKLQILSFLTPSVINNFLLRVLNINVNIFIFILITTFLFIKFFTASVITLICSAVILLLQGMFFKIKSSAAAAKINKANEEVNSAINESLLNIKSVKIMNAESYFYKNYSEKLENFRKTAKDLLFYNAVSPYVTEPFIIILLIILLAIISLQNMDDKASLIASYALIVSAIFRLAPTISRIQVNLTGINTSINQVKELLEYYDKLSLDNFAVIEDKKYDSFESSIELKDVSFSYGEKDVLKNINLNITKGSFVGIAGSSGVGKTTLADILAGLLNIKTGEIYIDGNFVKSNKMPNLKIGYIPQDYGIISATIRENVAFGDTNPDDKKVCEALEKARLLDFVKAAFKEGIYAKPFVDSIGFSQGQKQRLAIARVLYLNPDIIILDEATSSLDLKTEDEICEVLNALKGEKTIIAIAHRLSTIKSADRIIYMKDSTIDDAGTFEDLFNRNSDFRELVRLNNANSVH